jgi:MYXO-CTERM domain-containing protein
VLVANGTSCDDTIVCNGADTCMAGACMHAGAPDCSDTNACTTDTCVEAAVMCMHAPIANCCTDATDCDDHDACTTNGCTHAGGVCTFDPITDCCSTNAECDDGNACTTDTCETTAHHCAHANACIDAGPDAGNVPHDAGAGDASRTDASATDAGRLPVPRASGCACTAAGGSRHEGWGVLTLIALGLIARRRSRIWRR